MVRGRDGPHAGRDYGGPTVDPGKGPIPEERARAFLAVAREFSLGELVTEMPHPRTRTLSTMAAGDLRDGLRALHDVDAEALGVLAAKVDEIGALSAAMAATLDKGKRIFLCGCGATGRLAIACETLWRSGCADRDLRERVLGFMAGGDIALIRSLEGFEDHPEYGARQLEELGFAAGDLLVGITEGGETPFVIGATLRAAELSPNNPFFLFCNPPELLCRVAQRSARVLGDPRVRCMELTVGPMALAGSTRMQAATVQTAAVGLALLHTGDREAIGPAVEQLRGYHRDLDPSFLADFVLAESDAYRRGEHVLYHTDAEYAVPVLTDTTERSPTFSMQPFENSLEPGAPQSLCYLYLPEAGDSRRAWQAILGREPRTLEWPEINGIASRSRLLGFDFGVDLPRRRSMPAGRLRRHVFSIRQHETRLRLGFPPHARELSVERLPGLSRHLVLKMLLNMHSSLVMGRLGRYEGNMMTWVRPSNNKLIDRAVRYAGTLLEARGVAVSYEELVRLCFAVADTLPRDTSLVNAMVAAAVATR